MLTKKQFELLKFIDARLRESNVAPSYDEMKDALNLKSKSGIHRLIKALEERGFIRRLPHRARALEILRMPETVTATSAENHAESESRVIRPDFTRGSRPGLEAIPGKPSAAETLDIPLHGRIAAGTPIEALQQEGAVSVPASMLGRGEHYALQVSGDSMVEAGILDGDTIIIRRADTADNGDIVVALVDGIEATLKTIHKRGEQVALEPANSAYETQIYPANKVRVQGRLVGLLRQY
ncbi:MAG: transcriptional repressor LexA [Alphaproteobacteria bacterium]|nr:MAG: transcriptional repressor LexA [Alphaproteobacteria bacterium]